MLGNRHSQHSFAQIPSINAPRSQFNRSHNIKTTFDFDYLVPIFIDEIIPGDTCNLTLNCFARLATQKVPLMDNLYIDFFFFFVPNRLVWNNWEKFCGAQDDPGDSTDFLIPTITMGVAGAVPGSIYDQLGIPTDQPDLEISALPLRGYNLIWNSWFRDQNLQDSVQVDKDDGPDAEGQYVLLKRGRRHDYFASCLPWPQKGTAVDLPLGTSAPVVTNNTVPTFSTTGAGFTDGTFRSTSFGTGNHATFGAGTGPSADMTVTFGNNSGLIADLSTATAATINQLLEAFAVQALQVRDARGGTRYVELVLSHFGVMSPDFRLARPEFLGGGETRINSHPVPQTSPTSGANAQAQLASFATASTAGRSVGFTKTFTEHGFVIGMACARADITYQQGLHRMWSRQTRYDHFWPDLQEIGEQAVLTKELYATGDPLIDNDVFGYIGRYDEYRFKPSEIRGEFRSQHPTPLDHWHMAEEFSSQPLLNDDFIVQNTPIERALAVSGAPHLLFDAWFDYKHARPMMTYHVPASLGRF